MLSLLNSFTASSSIWIVPIESINAFRSLDYSEMVNLWLTNKLFDVDNHADEILPAVLVQDNVKAETWNTYADWDLSLIDQQKLFFSPASLTSDKTTTATIQSFSDHLPGKRFNKYKQDFDAWRADILSDQPQVMAANRLQFKTDPVKQDQLLRGVAHLKLKVASDQDHGMLSAMLVDYGSAKRLGTSPTILKRKAISEGFHWREDDLNEFQLQAKTPWKMISKGHINLQNRTTNYKVDELEAGKFYDLEFDLQPTFYHLPAGHQLGLVIYATDMEMTVRANEEINYSLDLANCQMELTTSQY